MRPLVAHVTTTDISLALLLGPQLRAFQEAGYEVVGISASGPWVADLERDGIRHVPMRHATRAMAPIEDLRALRELRDIFRRLQPAIVHTHNPKPGVYGRLAAWMAGVPATVNTVHGLYAVPEDPLPRRAVVYGLERLCSLMSDAELVQNPEDVRTLAKIGVPRTKLHLLGNGIDLTRFDPASVQAEARARIRTELGAAPGDVVVGIVGRLVREKGYLELFAAARRLAGLRPELLFVVIGPHEPDKSDAIDQEAIDAVERDVRVRFLGLRHDVEKFYAAMDVYVLPSHREGFPRSAMEAAAMSRPIITTNIRGGRQVVDDGRTGFLVPVRDAEALTAAIAKLADDPALRRAMGIASREKALREFDQQQQIRTTLDVYAHLVAGSRQR